MIVLIEAYQELNLAHYFTEIMDEVVKKTISNDSFFYRISTKTSDEHVCCIIDRIRLDLKQEVIKTSYICNSNTDTSFLSSLSSGLYISSHYLKICSNYFQWEPLGVIPDSAGNQSIHRLIPETRDEHITRKECIDTICSYWSDGNTQLLNIYGVSGIGKTTLLRQLPFFSEQKYIQIHSSGKTLSNHTWYSNLIDMNDAVENISTYRITDLIVEAHLAAPSTPIIIDNIHWLNEFDLQILDQLAVRNIKIFSTSWYPIATLNQWNTEKIKEVELLSFTQKEVEQLAAQSNHIIDKKTQETIYDLTQGHPLLAQHFINHSASLNQKEKSPTTLIDTHKTLAKDLSSNYFKNNKPNNYSLQLIQILASLPQAIDTKILQQFCSSHHELKDVMKKLLKLPFINEDLHTHAVTFQHDFYRQAVSLIPESPLEPHLLKSLAEHLELHNYHYSAAHLYSKIDLRPEQFNNLLITAKSALEEKNYLHLLDVVNATLPVADKCSLDDNQLAQLHWIAGSAHDKAGILEDVVYHYEQFLKSINIVRKLKFHLLLIHWLLGNRKQILFPTLKQSSFSPDQIAHVLRTLAEFYSYSDHGSKIVIETMYLYHIVHKDCSNSFNYLGECEMFISIVIQPLFGKNLAKKWADHGEYLAKKSNNRRAEVYSEILSFNILQYSPNWHSKARELNLLKLAEEARDKKLYSLAMRGFLIYLIYGLDKYDGHHANNFLKKTISPLLKYVPEWMKLWSSVASLLISSEIDHPTKTLFNSQRVYPKEIRSASLLTFAAAEMALDNPKKCKTWFDEFYQYKHQLQYINTVFSVIIKPLYEVAIYLYIKDLITRKQLKFVQNITKKHANLCYKSKPLLLGYQAIYKVIIHNSEKALIDLSEAKSMAKNRHHTSSEKLFELYLNIFNKGTIPKSNITGRDMRIKALHSCRQ